MKIKISKILVSLLIVITAICSTFIFTGCLLDENEVNITYQLSLPKGVNASIKSTTQKVVSGESYSLYVPVCEDSDYEFEGWKVKGTNKFVPLTGERWKYNEDVVLVAVWDQYTDNY